MHTTSGCLQCDLAPLVDLYSSGDLFRTQAVVSIRVNRIQTILERRAPLQLFGVKETIVVRVVLGQCLLGGLVRGVSRER